MRLDLSLYLVTDTVLCGPRGIAETARAAVAGGATVVQLRDPLATTRELYEMAIELRAAISVPLIVNDRLDVALAAGADGVHLGQSDLPVRKAREIAGPDFLIGLSISGIAELQNANGLPPGTVDYFGIGPAFATATKPDAGAALGPDLVAELAAMTELPTVAIGGITADNAARLIGVDGICVVSAICAADDPRAAAVELRKAYV